MGQNKLTIKKRTIGLIVFVVLMALIVGIFAAATALQWWVATISALAVPVVIAVGMVAAIVGYQNSKRRSAAFRRRRQKHDRLARVVVAGRLSPPSQREQTAAICRNERH